MLTKTQTTQSIPIEIQSLLETHTEPFVVIDREYRIIAVNSAYESTYGSLAEEAIGQFCYRISHDNDVPCCRTGEDCPHEHMFKDGKPRSCVHIHYDKNHRMHQVRVTGHPLRSADGELYMGEQIQEISMPENVQPAEKRMVGKAPLFTACLEQLKLVAASYAPVLLQGETGTGKELAAHYIHKHSPRCDMPYLTVDCTALTDTLFEAEVFGHARGAYTGSVGEKSGLFEQANKGTLFLDEIGELPMSQQAKLLRILETGQYRRVGGRGTRKVDVRIICATNRHLWENVLSGRFREDLYYRIACLSVRLPNLRERLDDIPLLAETLLEPVSRTMNRNFHLTPRAMECLRAYHYPGNVRELRNILFVAATHSENEEIKEPILTEVIGQLSRSRTPPEASVGEPQPAVAPPPIVPVKAAKGEPASANGNSSLDEVEAQHIRELLDEYTGNRRKVAASLGVSERTLYRKLKKYNLT